MRVVSAGLNPCPLVRWPSPGVEVQWGKDVKGGHKIRETVLPFGGPLEVLVTETEVLCPTKTNKQHVT